MIGKVFIVSIFGTSVLIGWILHGPLGDKDPPTLPDFYWGSTDRKIQKEDRSIRSFKINIDEKILTDLKTRLKIELSADRLTVPLEGIHFQYGFNTITLKKFTNHWLDNYDWRIREKTLNKYPQFKTLISGLDIHFQHVKGQSKKQYKQTRPLLLLHGWPGSFIEFQKVIPLLTDPVDSDTNFELVIPSLPGFGFSERPPRPGFGPVEAAQLFLKLMKRLGHNKFYVQGGDWGSLIVTNMAALYPEHVMAIHVNLCMSSHSRTHMRHLIGAIYPTLFLSEKDVARLYPLSKYFSNLLEESGYFHIQATKPDTVGAGLSNSPSGLLAYIMEKFSTGTNPSWKTKEDGGLIPYYNKDDLLDNIMIYWVTNTITSSMRFYAEVFTLRTLGYKMDNVPVKVPAGCLYLPYEISGHTDFHIQDKYHQLLSFSRENKGGHFAAFEVPDIFSKDLLKFFNLVENNSTIHKFTE